MGVEEDGREHPDRGTVARQPAPPYLDDRDRMGEIVCVLVEETVPEPCAQHCQDPHIQGKGDNLIGVIPGLTHLPAPEVISDDQHTSDEQTIVVNLYGPQPEGNRVHVPNKRIGGSP